MLELLGKYQMVENRFSVSIFKVILGLGINKIIDRSI